MTDQEPMDIKFVREISLSFMGETPETLSVRVNEENIHIVIHTDSLTSLGYSIDLFTIVSFSGHISLLCMSPCP